MYNSTNKTKKTNFLRPMAAPSFVFASEIGFFGTQGHSGPKAFGANPLSLQSHPWQRDMWNVEFGIWKLEF